MMTKGIKTSELWVVMLLIGQQFMQTIGADISGLPEAQQQVAELAQQLHAQAGVSNPSAMWVAMAYVVGRQLLKWREIGRS